MSQHDPYLRACRLYVRFLAEDIGSVFCGDGFILAV